MKLREMFKAVLVPPPAEELACKELAEAKRLLLHYQSAREYSTAMVQYESERIERLTAYLKNQ